MVFSNFSAPAIRRGAALVCVAGLLGGGAAQASGFCDGVAPGTIIDTSDSPHGGTCHQVRVTPPGGGPHLVEGSPEPSEMLASASALDEKCLTGLKSLVWTFQTGKTDVWPQGMVSGELRILEFAVGVEGSGSPSGPEGSSATGVSNDGNVMLSQRTVAFTLVRNAKFEQFLRVDLTVDYFQTPQIATGKTAAAVPPPAVLDSLSIALPYATGQIHAAIHSGGGERWSDLGGFVEARDTQGNILQSVVLPESFSVQGLGEEVSLPLQLRSGILGGTGLHEGMVSDFDFESLLGRLDDDRCLQPSNSKTDQ